MWIHLGIGLVVRMLLICFAEFQDKVSEVQYTDIDYRVFTNAARHVLQRESPYARHTYRYTPILAYLMTPNIFFLPAWGKIFFSFLDICVAILIKNIVILHYKSATEQLAEKCALVWLYNPLAIVISTRGNADSLAATLVILTVMLLKKERYWLAGIVHGLAIHTRLYPIVFSLAMYLSIPVTSSQKPKATSATSRLLHSLLPTYKRLKLTVGCLLTLAGLTMVFYKMYGNKFLDESVLYHFRRQDFRHNFSVYFYYQYLTMSSSVTIAERIGKMLPLATLLPVLSLVYGSPRDLPFSMLCQAIVLVTYNSVVTCQYFVWFVSLLPLCLPALSVTNNRWIGISLLWLSSQLAWLLFAYGLEFKGLSLFLYIWIQGIVFFCANVAVLVTLIHSYKPNQKLD